MNQFAVVGFTEESSVGIVPLSWLKNQLCGICTFIYNLNCQRQDDVEEYFRILLKVHHIHLLLVCKNKRKSFPIIIHVAAKSPCFFPTTNQRV